MKTMKSFKNTGCVLAMVSMMMSFSLQAAIQGVTGSAFELHAAEAQITTPDGDSIRLWRFSSAAGGVPQYPGPTLIADEGLVMVTVYNTDIPQNVSLVFPGQKGVTTECSFDGTTYSEAFCADVFVGAFNEVPGMLGFNSIRYSFTTTPGTYMYHSGVSPQIQIDMGLVGALIVRPTGMAVPADAAGLAYNDVTTAYDREYLFFLSEMDPKLHYLMEDNATAIWDNAGYISQLFFQNGRNAPDTLAADNSPQLPNQPYGNLVNMYPGERVLMRVLNAGRNQHPFHTHGNHFNQVARDGNLMASPVLDYTLNAIPGSTADMIWDWTGKGMGWDIYNGETAGTPGHLSCIDTENNRTGAAGPDGFADDLPGNIEWEWCADHGKPLPVVIPENQDLAFGGLYGGSPFLGDTASLPIGEGGLNPNGGMVFMWHSHSERELTNNDIFPGGMLTMMIVERRP